MDSSQLGSSVHGVSPDKNTRVDWYCPFPEDLSNQGIKPRFPALQADSLPPGPPGKPWLIGKDLVAGKDWRQEENGDDRGWDGWMASLTRWIWVWASSGSLWGTGKPGMLQFMGLQRVGHGWVTEMTDCMLETPSESSNIMLSFSDPSKYIYCCPLSFLQTFIIYGKLFRFAVCLLFLAAFIVCWRVECFFSCSNWQEFCFKSPFSVSGYLPKTYFSKRPLPTMFLVFSSPNRYWDDYEYEAKLFGM